MGAGKRAESGRKAGEMGRKQRKQAEYSGGISKGTSGRLEWKRWEVEVTAEAKHCGRDAGETGRNQRCGGQEVIKSHRGKQGKVTCTIDNHLQCHAVAQ